MLVANYWQAEGRVFEWGARKHANQLGVTEGYEPIVAKVAE